MKKMISMIAMVLIIGMGTGTVVAEDNGVHGPAPNSGDGVPDGSGFDTNNGPNGSGTAGSGNGPMGPAPNSGDGIADGSGFDTDNGPNGIGLCPASDSTSPGTGNGLNNN